jgi:ferric-dicitrate binding protein FerR (iron transport regulator)
LTEKYLDGLLAEHEQEALQAHVRGCRACREELEACLKVASLTREAFGPDTSPAEARTRILAAASRVPVRGLQQAVPAPACVRRRLVPVLAGSLVILAILLGLAPAWEIVGRRGSAVVDPEGPAETGDVIPRITERAGQVPIRIARLEGTVLVRHRDSDEWEDLNASARVYLGDTFRLDDGAAMALLLQDNSTITLGSNSTLALEAFDGGAEFGLERGAMEAMLNAPRGPFVVTTPHGRIEALGTEFTVSVE